MATATQCHIYSTSNFNTPHLFDLHQPLQLLLQCERSLLLVDATAGMQVVTYDGRAVCNPKAAGMQPELLSREMVSLCPELVAALDGPGGSSVRLFDTAQVGAGLAGRTKGLHMGSAGFFGPLCADRQLSKTPKRGAAGPAAGRAHCPRR